MSSLPPPGLAHHTGILLAVWHPRYCALLTLPGTIDGGTSSRSGGSAIRNRASCCCLLQVAGCRMNERHIQAEHSSMMCQCIKQPHYKANGITTYYIHTVRRHPYVMNLIHHQRAPARARILIGWVVIIYISRTCACGTTIIIIDSCCCCWLLGCRHTYI
jgi:hypothetical protein